MGAVGHNIGVAVDIGAGIVGSAPHPAGAFPLCLRHLHDLRRRLPHAVRCDGGGYAGYRAVLRAAVGAAGRRRDGVALPAARAGTAPVGSHGADTATALDPDGAGGGVSSHASAFASDAHLDADRAGCLGVGQLAAQIPAAVRCVLSRSVRAVHLLAYAEILRRTDSVGGAVFGAVCQRAVHSADTGIACERPCLRIHNILSRDRRRRERDGRGRWHRSADRGCRYRRHASQ